MNLQKRWVEKTSPEGYKYRVWETPMIFSRVPPNWLNCSFYVYKTVDDANAGAHSGGSGCLIGWPSKYEGWFHLYAVTNRHVLDGGFGVLRLNTTNGKTSTIETQWSDWETLDASGDVAVKAIDLEPGFRWKPILVEDFITKHDIARYKIWPGDETFLIGRLMNQSGRQRNTPVARFGHLSMLADPTEPVDMDPYGEHEAFLVECRSISGFSGSPVFLTTTQVHGEFTGVDPIYQRQVVARALQIEREHVEESTDAGTGKESRLVWTEGTFGPWFLGIDRGHVPLWKPVYETDLATKTVHRVEHNTGMAVVIPAWRIRDILEKEVLVKQRQVDDEEIGKKHSAATIADLGNADENSDEKRPFTQSDFETALKKASRKTEPQK